jgi:VanZ family protein
VWRSSRAFAIATHERRDLALQQFWQSGLLCCVLKLKPFAKYWLPVVLWCVLIFSASGDRRSVNRSSRIIEPFVRWLIPDISDEAVVATVFVVRKIAHVTEFAILAMLLRRAAQNSFWTARPGWSCQSCCFAAIGAILFAMTDEYHQTFVPGRQGTVMDVLIDSIGVFAGLGFIWLLGRWRKKW